MDNSISNDVNRGNHWGEPKCDTAAKQFATCMGDNGGNMQICQWYLDQLVCDSSPNPRSTEVNNPAANNVITENMPSNGKTLLDQEAGKQTQHSR